MKRISCSLLLAAALAFGLQAEGAKGQASLEIQGDYGFPNHEAVDSSGLVPIVYGTLGDPATQRVVGSSIGSPEAKAILAYAITLPALAGEGALTKGNNLELEASGELSPVSLNANFKATLTPIAFLKLAAGASVGTGWDIGFIGLGLNLSGVRQSQPFGGAVYHAWVGGTFQFDLAAVLPGDWNHIVVLASPKVVYQAYSGAAAGQAWIWEADKGMNFNGLKLTGDYLVGYQMPMAFDLVGLLLQTEGWLGDVRGKAPLDGSAAQKWGSDFTYLTFGPLFDFKLGDKASIAILPQFKTGIKYSAATAMDMDFQARVYEAPYAYFYRLAFDYSLKL
jgi:hypothetical protein